MDRKAKRKTELALLCGLLGCLYFGASAERPVDVRLASTGAERRTTG